ncbi:MAG: hypothetical protein HYZ75_08815 [Elusimicrobia bacterium]|nr:hypothetical protein [Elusimicrobiota bacterium]
MKAFLLLAVLASAAIPRMPLRHEPKCVLEAVAFAMNVRLDPSIAPPPIRLETETPLAEFADALQPQWGSRPEVFTNAYSPSADRIFLIEDAGYYGRLKRDIADSLAHEYVHFIQVRYKGLPISQFGDSEESEAVHVQTWFRDHYIRGSAPSGAPACPAR